MLKTLKKKNLINESYKKKDFNNIENIFSSLGIFQYFKYEHKRDNINFSKDNKPENTIYGILKKRNLSWYTKINKTLSLKKNENKTFIIVVGASHLFLDEFGIIELLSEDYIIEKVEVRPIPVPDNKIFFNTGGYDFSPDRLNNSNPLSYKDIEV